MRALPFAPGPSRARARGAALLMALMVVALISALASAALWQQSLQFNVESTERDAQQARWLLGSALDWARLVLRQDALSSKIDALTEPWAVPLKEVKLSAFLAAIGNNVDDTSGLTNDIFLSGRISDLQSRLNVRNLYDTGKIIPTEADKFRHLFQLLDLPMSELESLLKALALASTPRSDKNANLTLMPQRVEQLSWFGLSHETLKKLAPYVTWLPLKTSLNLNTASAPVLQSAIPGLDASNAKRLVSQRDEHPWDNLESVRLTLGRTTAIISDTDHTISSNFFEIFCQMRMHEILMLERSVVQRDGINVKTLWRERRPQGSELGCPISVPQPC